MCFGSRPQPPQIIYQGPSQEEIDRQNAQLETLQQERAKQQKQITDQLQRQVDDANASIKKQQEQLAAEQAAAASRAAQQAQQVKQGSYSTQTMAVTPTSAQTTSAVQEKPRPGATLKILPGSTAANTGVGLNIGM